MIGVWVSEEMFRYDADSLVKAFYPNAEVRNFLAEETREDMLAVRVLEEETILCIIDIKGKPSSTRSELRNTLKRRLYNELKTISGIELPWGALTGVRPVRLAAKLIREKGDTQKAAEAMRELYYVSREKAELAVEIAERERGVIGNIGEKKGDGITGLNEILPGYSLYVGIPFCPSRCSYCSFASYPIERWKDRLGEYFAALSKELDTVGEIFGSRSPDTIYIGGGTPTSLDEEALERLLCLIEEKINITDVIEYTLEAGRPDSITEAKLKCMKKHGIERMCVNPQTMNDRTLERIGRHHSADNTRYAFGLARQEGFENINMDIILGLPGENGDDVRYTLEEIEKLGPDDLTVHSLAIKRGSDLKEALSEKEGNKEEEGLSGLHNSIVDLAAQSAKRMGLKPYYLYRQKNIAGNLENTGYARPGKEGIYNIVIMEEIQSLIACGAGTVSKRVSADGRNIRRCDTPKDLEQYLSRIDEMTERKRDLFGQ